jgi:hypothetical protein
MALFQTLRARIETPAAGVFPRAFFGVLAGIVAVESGFELWSWFRGAGRLVSALGLAGISFLMLFCFAREPRARLLFYLCGVVLVLVRIVFYVADALHAFA